VILLEGFIQLWPKLGVDALGKRFLNVVVHSFCRRSSQILQSVSAVSRLDPFIRLIQLRIGLLYQLHVDLVAIIAGERWPLFRIIARNLIVNSNGLELSVMTDFNAINPEWILFPCDKHIQNSLRVQSQRTQRGKHIAVS